MSPVRPPPLPRRLRRQLGRVQTRIATIWLLAAIPLVAAVTVIAIRFAAVLAAIGVLMIGVGGVLGLLRAIRQYDRLWLIRRLDLLLPQLEDSVGLVLAPMAVTPLQRFQQQRIGTRLDTVTLPDLRPAWPRRRLAMAWLTGAAMIAPTLWAPHLQFGTGHDLLSTKSPGVIAGRLTIHPPGYTGIAVFTVNTLDASAPIGSSVGIELKPPQTVKSAALVFDDGSLLTLKSNGNGWSGEYPLAAAALYRIEGEGVADGSLHRLDAIPDRPPEVTVQAPDKTLTVFAESQGKWDLAFEASDDYGLGKAELSISLAQGSGENIQVSRQTLQLEGSGDARHRSYKQSVDLAALHFAKGDDLIVRLAIADNRAPQPNVTRSASFILRWPPEASTETAGMAGVIEKTMPAYFRSERQLIIDTEALLADQPTIAADRFVARADSLGVDQKVLHLRYGQFLGEEFEGSAEHTLAPSAAGKDGQPTGAEALKNRPSDAGPPPQVASKDGDLMAEFGHIHDKPGAATLFDPETRRILKAALDEMWQAELQLRQAEPNQALPYENKALELIKQVQQAERIYLARDGVELPKVDAERRLTGKRDELNDRSRSAPAAIDDSPVLAFWRALDSGATPDAAALRDWVHGHRQAVTDSLGLLAAIEGLERDPACDACRDELRTRLWPLLPTPAAAVVPRATPDAAGAAYRDRVSGKSP